VGQSSAGSTSGPPVRAGTTAFIPGKLLVGVTYGSPAKNPRGVDLRFDSHSGGIAVQ
jgi:hypothetical protein